jgi:FlaA1/EpsC-like NDP-sugar epimerase
VSAFSTQCSQFLAARKKRTLIWGAGSGGVRALQFLRQLRIPVHAFIDSDPGKIGTSIRRHPVLAPAALGTSPWRRASTAVFIASSARQQIEVQLASLGWRSCHDYFSIPQAVLDQTRLVSPSIRA